MNKLYFNQGREIIYKSYKHLKASISYDRMIVTQIGTLKVSASVEGAEYHLNVYFLGDNSKFHENTGLMLGKNNKALNIFLKSSDCLIALDDLLSDTMRIKRTEF